MGDALKAVQRLAASDVPVLIRGENGTGKELVAWTIHKHSRRAGGPFQVVTRGAVPQHLLESELFGHEKGAFAGAVRRRCGRFELASGGTVFLNEVGHMSRSIQGKIMRTLEKRVIKRVGGETPVFVDVHVIAATNRDLRAAVVAGRFREDLYSRLADDPIYLPPLRERGDDVRLLAEHFLAHYAREYGRPVHKLAPKTLRFIYAHPWPGNVRQLRHAIEGAVLRADSDTILPAHMFPETANSSPE